MIKFLKKILGSNEESHEKVRENRTTTNTYAKAPLSANSTKRTKSKKTQEKPYKQLKIPKDIVDRNLKGRELEKEGYVDNAIEFYEKNVEERCEGNHPYDRLAIIYRRRKQYDEEIRVLKRAIDVFQSLESSSPRQDVSPKLQKFQERLEKAKEKYANTNG
ncbi:tetratricopeptide repeat protein [Halobacillus seohaensis]|uniref:Tetratricopeptide repeat protein n=1 Tax=Halobacillus seohaensis TaxID=447421 RepID=A0ABW2EP86_9BACI